MKFVEASKCLVKGLGLRIGIRIIHLPPLVIQSLPPAPCYKESLLSPGDIRLHKPEVHHQPDLFVQTPGAHMVTIDESSTWFQSFQNGREYLGIFLPELSFLLFVMSRKCMQSKGSNYDIIWSSWYSNILSVNLMIQLLLSQ